jgi:hypothetical protein
MAKSTQRTESRDQAISWLVSQLRWERMLGEFRGVHVPHDDAARAA